MLGLPSPWKSQYVVFCYVEFTFNSPPSLLSAAFLSASHLLNLVYCISFIRNYLNEKELNSKLFQN